MASSAIVWSLFGALLIILRRFSVQSLTIWRPNHVDLGGSSGGAQNGHLELQKIVESSVFYHVFDAKSSKVLCF